MASSKDRGQFTILHCGIHWSLAVGNVANHDSDDAGLLELAFDICVQDFVCVHDFAVVFTGRITDYRHIRTRMLAVGTVIVDRINECDRDVFAKLAMYLVG